MRLGSTKLFIVPFPLSDLRRPALSRGLPLVMRPAEGSEVGLAMVITSNNVIHVGRILRAPLTLVVNESAAKGVAPQDALSECCPVGRETTSPIRTGPLRHSAVTALNVVTERPRPCMPSARQVMDSGLSMGLALYDVRSRAGISNPL